jgi:hypothetical protein
MFEQYCMLHPGGSNDAVATHALGMNPGGATVGTYADTNNVTHGCLASFSRG